MPKILLVANVSKEHVRKFHIPTIQRLVKNGWIVDVACKLDAGIPEASQTYAMCWERNPFTIKTLKGIRQLRNLIAANDYDIIYCHTPVGGLVARFAARKFRKHGLKVVYCAHGLHFFKGAPLLNWLVYYPMERLMARFTDMFITINDEDFNIVKKKLNSKMVIKIINGIGVNFDRLMVSQRRQTRKNVRSNLNIPSNAIVLIYVAEILRNKNQSMLINALYQLRHKGHNCYLLLAGPDHQNGEFENLAHSLQLEEYVKFLGWRNDIGELMCASDICVASSIREGFGINLIEAMFCHLPVIATSNRGHRAIIKDGENGFLVPLNDYATMAAKIEEVVGNKDLYDRLANIDVSNYSCSMIAKNIEEILATEIQ